MHDISSVGPVFSAMDNLIVSMNLDMSNIMDITLTRLSAVFLDFVQNAGQQVLILALQFLQFFYISNT